MVVGQRELPVPTRPPPTGLASAAPGSLLYQHSPRPPLIPHTAVVVSGLFQGYLAYNMARKALAVAAPGLSSELGLSKTDLGLVSSSFTAAYGVAKFAGSVITDHFSCRALFSIGLLLTGLLCFVFSLSKDLPRFCLLWSLHGVVQGAGWPSLAKICVEQVPPSMQGRAWALLSAAGNFGHVAAGPLLLTLGGGWTRIMRGAGSVAILAGALAWILTAEEDGAPPRLTTPPPQPTQADSPPPVTSASPKASSPTAPQDPSLEASDCASAPSSPVVVPPPVAPIRPAPFPFSPQFWQLKVLVNSFWVYVDIIRRILRFEVAALLCADSLVYFVVKGLADWSVLALTETKGLREKEAVNVFFYCELGAIAGSFASGYVSDRVGGLRTSTMSIFALLSLPFLYATGLNLQGWVGQGSNELVALGVAYFGLGLFINGPKTLSGIALRQLVPPQMAGTATGVQAWVGQVGASWAGAPVGFVAQHYGWGAIRLLWGASILSSTVLLAVPGLLRQWELRKEREGLKVQ